MRQIIIVLMVALVTGCGRLGFDGVVDGSQADGTGSPATSCGALANTCGPMVNAPCCESPVVGGGAFFRGYDVAADSTHKDMSRPATVGNFRLDRYEVTVGRFRAFVAAGQGTQANPPPSGAGQRTLNGMADQGGWEPPWNARLVADATALVSALTCDATYQTWTDAPTGKENQPIVCITWYEAMAFCAWDGGFLPTEAESMYAASGGNLQRAYPWSIPAASETIDCTNTNYGGASWPSTACVGAGANTVGSVSPAGDGVWGQSDLGGNVWEWALDSYATLSPAPCTDCANLLAASTRVLRGGSYVNVVSPLRVGFRFAGTPSDRFSSVGVRCARKP